MKYLLFFFLAILVSCVATKKTYICGDHACLDKKEFKEYFAETLTVEVKIKKSKQNLPLDLVKLNTNTPIDKNNAEISDLDKKKLNKKEQKALIKARKLELKEKRKIKRIEENKKIKNEKKISKLKIKKKKSTPKTFKKKIPIIDTAKKVPISKKTLYKKNNIFQNSKSIKQLSVCEKIENCDIDKITELLIKKGKKKDFPDITSK